MRRLFKAIKVTLPQSLYTKEQDALQQLNIKFTSSPREQNRIIRTEEALQIAFSHYKAGSMQIEREFTSRNGESMDMFVSFTQAFAPKGLISELTQLQKDEIISSFVVGSVWEDASFTPSNL